MRRPLITALILALWVSFVVSVPAWAHPGATVFEITVGAPTSISVLVPADYGQPIVEVIIHDAPGFELQGGESPGPPWTLSRRGDVLDFTGGSIPINDPATLFTIRGVAPHKGELVFPVTVRSPNGTVMNYFGGPGTTDQGVVVYAGETPASPIHHPFPWLTLAGVVAIVVGVLGTGAILYRRRVPAPER
jgi:hypothetical protein